MKTYIYYVLLLCMFTSLQGENYFIRLNQKGLTQRQSILKSKIQLKKSPAQLKIRTLGKIVKFEQWLNIEGSQTQLDSFLNDLKMQELVEFIEPVGHFRITEMSYDSLFIEQWYLDKIHIQQAWDITLGQPEIIIGVIDTGVDYTHPDLVAGLWQNNVEAQGEVGIDDDGNGYVDDIVGWDFTDVPRFPDGGDYLDEDNDPMDEFGSGHGTQVAGLISARANGMGINGIAPGVRVMPLRAGTASGYLEEDDVVRAVLYALDNGARIINMSFGDTALSQLLRDVLHYAHEQGVVLITSAGNSANDEIQFPAALDETISVGASTINDYLAGFSSYGATLDLVAPGDSIISTAVGGGYNLVNGTSFSAPIVSAVSGLILSVEPDFTPAQVRNILKTSTEDILYSGWDFRSGSGRLDAGKALIIPQGGILQINTPEPNLSTAKDSIWISGSIMHPDLLRAELAYGIGSDPQEWIHINSFEREQVLNDTLGKIVLTHQSDTLIEIRLRMELVNGVFDELHRQFRIDRSYPVISRVKVIPMFDGLERAVLITFSTDDFCETSALFRPSGAEAFLVERAFPYVGQNHILKLPASIFSGSYEFYVQAVNSSGLVGLDNNRGAFYSFNLDFSHNWTSFSELPWEIPSGYFLDKAVDLDADGNQEIILSRYDSDYAYGPIELYEFSDNSFVKQLETGFTAIPRDAGDVDGDGKSDMLLGYGQHAFLFEATIPGSFPHNLVWLDTTNFWAAGFTDLNADGQFEIVGRKDESYIVQENTADNQFSELVALENPTAGLNQYGPPRIRTADFNSDGRPEILFGDYDGDLLVYSVNTLNEPQLVDTLRSSQQDATGIFTADSSAIFVASHTDDEAYYEHEVDARYWSVDYFKYEPIQNKFQLQQTLHFSGYKNQKDFDSGLQLAKLSGKSYLFASFFPNLYLFEVQESGLTLVWFSPEARSNGVLVSDFNGDGWQEFYYNRGDKIIGFSDGPVLQPEPPVSFTAEPLDTMQITLNWTTTSDQATFYVYRGTRNDSLSLLLQTNVSTIVDTVAMSENWYFYALAVLDSTYAIPLGQRSEIDSAYTATPPRLIGLSVQNNRQLLLQFNSNIQLKNTETASVHLIKQNQHASSVVPMPDAHFALATFANPFEEARLDTIEISNIFGHFGTPIDQKYRQWPFEYVASIDDPIIQKSEILNKTTVRLHFSQKMNESSLLSLENYKLTPSGEVISVTILDSACSAIELIFSDNALAGGLGQAAYLELINLRSENGSLLGEGTKINLFVAATDLDNLLIYPQPVRPDNDVLIFAKVPQNAQISIFDLHGKRIWKQTAPAHFGGVEWNLKDLNHRSVVSGIYLYEIVFENRRKLGKVVVVR